MIAMRKVCALAIMLIALAGCKSKPIYHGPNYPLAEFPDKAAAGPVAVEIVDARPFWEKRYYEGGTAFLPLENLRPSPMPLLNEEIQREAQGLPSPPNRVVVKLNSFRIVIRDNKQEEADKAIADDQQQCLDDADPDDLVGTLIGILLEDGIRGLIRECRRGIEEWGQKERHLKGPPRSLDGKYELGASCEIRAVATLEWSNGQRRDVPLRALVNSEELSPENGIPFGRNNDVRAAVLAACNQVASEWKERTLHPNVPAENPAPLVPAPQFSAFSGK
jgi:hypothetical protein